MLALFRLAAGILPMISGVHAGGMAAEREPPHKVVAPDKFTCAVLTLNSCYETAHFTNLRQLPDADNSSYNTLPMGGRNLYNCAKVPNNNVVMLAGDVTGTETGHANADVQEYNFQVTGDHVTLQVFDSKQSRQDRYDGKLIESYSTSFTSTGISTFTQVVSFAGADPAGKKLDFKDVQDFTATEVNGYVPLVLWAITC